jgi:hypothetical protein
MIKATLKIQERDNVSPSYHVAPITEPGGEAWDDIIPQDDRWVECRRLVDGVSTVRMFPSRVIDSYTVIDDGKD